MMNLGVPELMIVLVIIIILFGVGRVSRIGGELGEAIGNFRKGVKAAQDEINAEDEA